MDKKVTEEIERFRESLKKLGVKVSKIIIFGSYAIGKAGEHSDIDVVVLSDDFRGMDILKRLELIGIALAKAKVVSPIEAIGYTEEEYESGGRGSFIGDKVKAKGIEVYTSRI